MVAHVARKKALDSGGNLGHVILGAGLGGMVTVRDG